MTIYAELFEKNTFNPEIGIYNSPLGSNSILKLDGRKNKATLKVEVIELLKKRNRGIDNWAGFNLHTGNSLADIKLVYAANTLDVYIYEEAELELQEGAPIITFISA